MECKYLTNIYEQGWVVELIDTLWNVNICKGLNIHLQDIELIDTLWNVNAYCLHPSQPVWQN